MPSDRSSAPGFSFVRLAEVAAALRKAKLEAVLVGNGAANVMGTPLGTLDLDFFVRDTPLNRAKIRKVARLLQGIVARVSELSEVLRISSDRPDVDFLFAIGPWTFASVRARATPVQVGSEKVLTAPLDLVVESKERTGREKDKAVLPILKQALRLRNELLASGAPIGPAAVPARVPNRRRPS